MSRSHAVDQFFMGFLIGALARLYIDHPEHRPIIILAIAIGLLSLSLMFLIIFIIKNRKAKSDG